MKVKPLGFKAFNDEGVPVAQLALLKFVALDIKCMFLKFFLKA